VVDTKPDQANQAQDLTDEISSRTLHLMGLLGQVGPTGRLRAEGRDKIAQVLAFLPLMQKVVDRTSKKRELVVLECASGKGHLSLLMNQILSETLDREVYWVGVDSSARLVGRCRSIADSMGFENVEYHRSRIADFTDERDIAVLTALHACDTATDEALVKGLELSCRHMLLVPCCQREVAKQLAGCGDPRLLPMIGNYTHRKILGSILTDSLRRLVLEAFGYEVDVFEYVSVRRTEKNMMIRATSGIAPRRESWDLLLDTINTLGLRLTLVQLLADRDLSPAFDQPP
jgi:hypothetical protein